VGRGHAPPPLAAWQYTVMRINSKPIQLQRQYCENGLQIENKSQEILHHLGTQKDAKLCLK